MTEENYKELNYYLNMCCNYLNRSDCFFLNNIPRIAYLSEKFSDIVSKQDLKIIEEEEKLTFNDVFLLAREIIETINPDYLENYDNIIQTGELDFSYDNFYWGSHVHYGDIKEININRTFTYGDVNILVHEFIHYQNVKKYKSSIYHYLLSEFLSIYYEIYACKYLVKEKEVPISKIDFDRRFIYEKKNCDSLTAYSMPLICFEKFGEVDENCPKMLEEYGFVKVEKNEFDSICLELLNIFKNIEKKYLEKMRFKEEYNVCELEKRLALKFSELYRYILGTLLACYAIENCDIKKITYLNDHITDDKYRNMATITDVLKTIDINLDAPDINKKLLISLENVLNKGDLCKK